MRGQSDTFLRLFLYEVWKILDGRVNGLLTSGNLSDSQLYLEHHADTGRSIDNEIYSVLYGSQSSARRRREDKE